MDGRLQVFAGNSHPRLATAIMQELESPLGRAIVGEYENGETRVKLDENVRGSDVFVIQSICTPYDHHLMELLLIIDALRRASAARITAVIPYYGYSKQEKKTTGREPITAKLVANLITVAGANRVLTVDLHAPAIEGFFDIPVDHLRATPLLAGHCRRLAMDGAVVVSPDAGGVARAEEFRSRSGGSLGIVTKHEPTPDGVSLEMVGDVSGKVAIIVDDMISTGTTLEQAVTLLNERGAAEIHVAATHAIFAADAAERTSRLPIKNIYVTDTVPHPTEPITPSLTTITVAPLLAEAIMRIHKDLSISALFT